MSDIRVAFLTPFDSSDPDSWSGMPYAMREALGDNCRVFDVPTSDLRPAAIDRALARAHGSINRTYLTGHSLATSMRSGVRLSSRLRSVSADVILAVVASQETAFLRTNKPLIAVSDATLPLALRQQGLETAILPMMRHQATFVERRAWQRASTCVVTSQWARHSLIDDYRIPPDKCQVVPFGPGIGAGVRKETGSTTPETALRMIAVMRDWHRKQGDIVLETFRMLSASGVDASLTIVGNVPPGVEVPPGVRLLGTVDRRTLTDLYSEHDVLLDLSKSNAVSVTIVDALSCGLPVIATDVGAVHELIDDGQSGFIVELSADTAKAAAKRASLLSDRTVRTRMGARVRGDGPRQTWDDWANQMLEIIDAERAKFGARRPQRRGL